MKVCIGMEQVECLIVKSDFVILFCIVCQP